MCIRDRCLAAYCGQIEIMDGQIGEVKREFQRYAKRNGHKAVMGYVSDHGDCCLLYTSCKIGQVINSHFLADGLNLHVGAVETDQ